jgi:hypothetical protein
MMVEYDVQCLATLSQISIAGMCQLPKPSQPSSWYINTKTEQRFPGGSSQAT